MSEVVVIHDKRRPYCGYTRHQKGINMHAFNVKELFQITGRGVVVVTDKTYETLPSC